MLKNKKFIIDGNLPIVGDLTFNSSDCLAPLVIFCHGYKGYKDWGCWNLVAKKFAENGIKFLKFNFSHNGGTVEQPIDFPDLEAFSKNNYSIELNDIGRVINYLQENKNSDFQFNKISIIGHSRGGGIACLAAGLHKQIENLVTWASVADFSKRFPDDDELENWKINGVRYVENKRTKQMMPHLYQFYLDFLNNKKKLDIKSALNSYKGNVLVCHGTLDQAVNVENAENISNWANKGSLFKLRANHTFGAKHPWDTTDLPEALNDVCDKTIRFLTKE